MSDAPLSRPSTLLDEARLPHDGSGRLQAARHLIEEGAVSVLTVDMFDTLVWRQVPRPTDAFVLLASDLARAGRLDPRITPATFRRIRIEAERRARELRRQRGEGVEVGIEEIWAQIPGHVRLDAPLAVLVEHELAVEQRIIRADLDVVALLERAVEAGCRLAVVSNTYLSAQQLTRLLARPETASLRQARVFASSAYGMSKADGLWKVVIEELDVAADRIVHVGDERPSDVEAPGELGVRTVWYPRYDEHTRDVLGREGVLGDVRVGPAAAVVVPGQGDYGLTALRAKVGARADVTPLPSDQAVAWRWGATVLGPALAGFAHWVNRQAEALGVTTVWCMMREGELLADLIGRVAASQDNGVRAETVWLSRHVTAKASIKTGEPDELRKLLARRLVPTVAEFLANLGIAVGEVPELRHAAGQRMDQPALAADVVETLGGNPHLRARIVAESAAVRARLLHSLEPALGTGRGGEAADPATVLVDLGWGGTIQRQLVEALRLAGVDRRIVGLYLATNEVATSKVIDGLDITGYLIDGGEPCSAIDEIGRSPEIIEQSCLAACGSLADVTEDGRPILDPFSAPPEQMASKTAVQHGARAFLREWLRYADAVRDWPVFDGGERPQLVEILRRSVSGPTSEEAHVFGAWTHDDNFGVDLRERVIPDRLGSYVPYLSPADLVEMSMQEAFWPLGLAAEYDQPLAAAAQAILAGHLQRTVFEGRRTQHVIEMAIDEGHGWINFQDRPLRINHNGLSYVHFDLRGEGIQTVRLDPCDGPAMWRVDWIELGLRTRGAPQPTRVVLQGGHEFSLLGYSGARWLYDGVGISVGADPELHIPLAGRAPGEVYGVELTAALAVFPLPPAPGDQQVPVGKRDFGTTLSWTIDKLRAEVAAGGPAAAGRSVLRMARGRLR